MKSTSYPGGKRAHGSYQQIINEIPPVSKVIIGFLGHCPVFEYMKSRVDTIAFEISDVVIREYWNDEPEIINDSFLKFQKLLMDTAEADTFFYLDPPYVRSSRRMQRALYKFEMDDNDHEQMIKTALQTNALVSISGYENDLYNDLLGAWRKKSWRVQTRSGPATETLWMNYDRPQSLLSYDFLGDDKTDRQRIKRKINRLISKLESLPVLERNAILSALEGR